MTILGIILLVLFCIVALLLIFLVTVQDENSVGLGGIFGGSSDSAFGSSTPAFLVKATTVLAIVFMVLSLVVAIVNKSTDAEIAAEITAAAEAETSTSWPSAETEAETVSWDDAAAAEADAETAVAE